MTQPDQPPDSVFGVWWLPSTPEHKVGGEMKLGTYGDRQLRLSGSIHPPPPGEKISHGPREELLIYGISQNNRRYSLMAAQRHETSFDYEMDGAIGERWTFTYHASSNRHIEPTTEVERVEVSFSTLPVWCHNQDSFSMIWGSRQGVTAPKTLEYSTSVRGADVTFYDTWQTSMIPSLCSIRHSPGVRIQINTTIEKIYSDWVWPLQQLFGFLTSEYAPVADLRVRTADNDEWIDLVPEVVTPVDSSKQPSLHDMLHDMFASKARLDHYAIDISELLKNWMLLADEQPYLLETINILGVRRYFYDDALLVFLFRTLELYHVSNLEGERFSETEYERRVKDILDGTRTELRSWLKGILKYQNRKSQRTKLKELLKQCYGVGDAIVERFPEFVSETVDLRNSTVHGRQLNTTNQSHSRKVCWYLEWITYRLILAELDIPSETADEIVINSWRSPFQ